MHARSTGDPSSPDRPVRGPEPPPVLTDPSTVSERSAWQSVQAARNLAGPTGMEYCHGVFDDFVELRGDRHSGDDRAVVGGLTRLAERTVVVIATQKGHEPAELVEADFGMPHPRGYHKARRQMDYADRFGFPVVTLLAKLIVWGADRNAALNRMGRALDELRMEGRGMRTTTGFHRKLVDHPVFRAGDISTAFLREHYDLG